MLGQWIGPYESTTSAGVAIIELDDFGNHWRGGAYAFSNNPGMPHIYAPVRTIGKDKTFDLTLQAVPIHPDSWTLVNWAELQPRYPGVSFLPTIKTRWQLDEETLSVEWASETGGSGLAKLDSSKANEPSDIVPETSVRTWSAFRQFAITLEPNRYIFRGQESNIWRLRTHFHRLGRSHLLRFISDDISALHANLSSMTPHIFNLIDPLQNAAFVSLIQHHGYPTPLLDWSYSPFIGAFFAFRNLRRRQRNEDARARIFVFDRQEWINDVPRFAGVSPAPPHFSFLSPLAINNPRMVPQQAISSVTNLDDIERFIRYWEKKTGKTYLRVIDLPSLERAEVMQELRLMGITAGAMFPGLDGACEQLKEQSFEV